MAMATINGLCVGESLVGDGNEVAHIDLIMGPRGSAAESAFAHALTNNKDGFTSLLAVVGPNLLTKPATVLFNKVTIKGAKQAVQMFGPAQHAVAKAVADSVAEGVIPESEGGGYGSLPAACPRSEPRVAISALPSTPSCKHEATSAPATPARASAAKS